MEATLLGLLIFFAGLVLGNWLAIGRDRRKEINDVAQKIRTTLLKGGGLDPIDADLYLQMLPLLRRWRFRRAVERHRNATGNYQQEPIYGDRIFTPEVQAEIAASVEELLRHARWR